MRVFIWFIIVSVNLVLGSNGAIQWAQCWPVEKLWYYDMEGTCFPAKIVQNYNTFVAGAYLPGLNPSLVGQPLMDSTRQLIRV